MFTETKIGLELYSPEQKNFRCPQDTAGPVARGPGQWPAARGPRPKAGPAGGPRGPRGPKLGARIPNMVSKLVNSCLERWDWPIFRMAWELIFWAKKTQLSPILILPGGLFGAIGKVFLHLKYDKPS